jgi:hypothetical protein
MSNDDANVALGLSLPLDSDGFLRRECPTCEREFKWFPSSDDDEPGPAPDGGYFCPYCGIQAPEGQWFTKAQVELAENLVATHVVGPMLKDFVREVNRVGGRAGVVSVTGEYEAPDEIEPLTEADDMKRVDFHCHPVEPVKVLDDWDGPVNCLVCGETA